MSKVRVPKEDRPPTRFGIIDGSSLLEGKKFRVKGLYRGAKKGETYYEPWVGHAVYAFAGPTTPRVILEEVKE